MWAGRGKQPRAVVPVPPPQESDDEVEDGERDGDDERDDDEQLIAAFPKKLQPYARLLLERVAEGDARIAALEDTVRTLKQKAVLYRYEVDGSDGEDGASGEGEGEGEVEGEGEGANDQSNDPPSEVTIAVLPGAQEEDSEDEEEVDELMEGPSTRTTARPQKRKFLPPPSSRFN